MHDSKHKASEEEKRQKEGRSILCQFGVEGPNMYPFGFYQERETT